MIQGLVLCVTPNVAGKFETATGAERFTEPVIVGIQLEPEMIHGVVPWVTLWVAGKFETATGAERETEPVIGPVIPTLPVTGTGLEPATETPPTRRPVTEPESATTFCVAGKLETATGAERETDPVMVGIQLDPETIQGDVDCVTPNVEGKFDTTTGSESPMLPVTRTVFSTATDPVILGIQLEPEMIHGEVPCKTVAGSARETEPVIAIVPEIVAEPGFRT